MIIFATGMEPCKERSCHYIHYQGDYSIQSQFVLIGPAVTVVVDLPKN